MEFDAIALTSANALLFCNLDDLSNKPVFTTGTATQKKAISVGFSCVQSAQGGAIELAALIQKQFQHQTARILYPSALETAHDLSKLLRPYNINCVNWPVYKAIEKNSFSQQALELFDKQMIDLVLFYSRRTASCFAKLWEKQTTTQHLPQLLAISQNVREALPKSLTRRCIVSSEPNELSIRQGIKDIFLQD